MLRYFAERESGNIKDRGFFLNAAFVGEAEVNRKGGAKVLCTVLRTAGLG
jgi:hypothetical protein